MSSEEPDRSFTMVDTDTEGAQQRKPGGDEAAIDFSTFVLSLGTSALYQMGQAANPESGAEPGDANLPAARQMIDTLEMLQEKTLGNLEPDEARLLESVLYELHLKFVEASK